MNTAQYWLESSFQTRGFRRGRERNAMSFSIRMLAKITGFALLSGALLVAILFAFRQQIIRAEGHRSISRPANVSQPFAAQSSEKANGPDGVIQLLLRPEGFDSESLAIAKGSYVLILLNRTGLEDLSLQVSRVVGNGEKPKDIVFDSKKKYRIDSLIDLTPGDYVVSVQGHPEWSCRISTRNQ